MASGVPMGAGRPRNNLRRNLANKTMGVPIGYFRPGTPYPKVGNVPLVAGPGGSLQLAQMGGRPTAYPLADSASSYSFAMPTPTYNPHAVLTENSRRRHELEELRAREGVVSHFGQAGSINTTVSNEVGLNIMGLTVSDSPIVRPTPKKAFITEEDETMTNN
ncbi:hypothetical protein M407DRAFT_23189 [Tulasnella calospora MUT 4182]|uniref:Uncharacterized protein n=1 Tax=Tulasnella calospora MUT 4182 TaxID=1051891 RepID=A0A0C3QB32_9AGAM|nr:hypothetical protein M407DRAFT_23189 [Tulasnella calospora MUT 4182]